MVVNRSVTKLVVVAAAVAAVAVATQTGSQPVGARAAGAAATDRGYRECRCRRSFRSLDGLSWRRLSRRPRGLRLTRRRLAAIALLRWTRLRASAVRRVERRLARLAAAIGWRPARLVLAA